MAQQTFNIAGNADDVYCGKVHAGVYPPTTGTFNEQNVTYAYTARDSSGGNYIVDNTLLRFDTSALPDDATITGATLRLFVQTGTLFSTNSLQVTCDYHDWSTGVVNDHYSHAPGTNAHTGTPISNLTAGATNDLALTNVDANISKTGTTYLRTHISQRASDAAPTGTNAFSIATFEDTNTEARLIVTYEEASWSGRTAPGAILGKKGLSGALTDIDDDPNSADANWLVVG